VNSDRIGFTARMDRTRTGRKRLFRGRTPRGGDEKERRRGHHAEHPEKKPGVKADPVFADSFFRTEPYLPV